VHPHVHSTTFRLQPRIFVERLFHKIIIITFEKSILSNTKTARIPLALLHYRLFKNLLMLFSSYRFFFSLSSLSLFLLLLLCLCFLLPFPLQGYAPLYVETDYFYVKWLYKRISDAWDRPITGVPGTYIDVLERRSTDMNASYTYVYYFFSFVLFF
jgi:hypothetical protein